ncbi:MAG: rod shape-determining protein MreC [Candidatus Eisenbacteria bacterium]
MRVPWKALWQKDSPVFIILVVISLGIMALGKVAGVNPVSNALGYVFLPFEALSYKMMNLAFVYQENHLLRGRLTEVSNENMMLREQVHEIDRLRTLLGFRDASPLPLKAAKVVADVDERLGGGIIIDKGYDQGLARNMTVVSPQGLVGLVIRAQEGASAVKRIVDPGSRVSACLQYGRTSGILRARTDGRLFMEWVAPDAEVEPGDTVISSGLGSVVPKGILIGKVREIQEDPDKFSLSLEVGAFVDFDRLEEVFVLMVRPSESGIVPEDIGSVEVGR